MLSGPAFLPLILGLGVALACIAAFVGLGDGARRRLARRARAIAAHRRGETSKAKSARLNLRRDTRSGLDVVMQRFVPRPELLRRRLAATGMPLTIGQYVPICVGVALVVTVALLLFGLAPAAALLVGLMGGLWLPHMVVGRLIKRRLARFQKLFPEAIALMVRGIKAGLPVTETMVVVGREIGDPVGEEFRRIGDQVRLGQPVEEAMWGTARRLDLAEFNFLVITMTVQRETGGNLGETLENLEDILRRRHQMKLKVKAISSEARASATIIGALPFVMFGVLYALNHDYVVPLLTTDTGHMLMGGGLGCILLGALVMAKMVSFEI